MREWAVGPESNIFVYKALPDTYQSSTASLLVLHITAFRASSKKTDDLNHKIVLVTIET